MFKHILIPTDGSPLSERAALGAVHLAKSLSARVTAIYASVPFHVFAVDPVMVSDTEDTYQRTCEKRAAAYLEWVRVAAKTSNVPFDALHVFAESPYTAIIDAAKEKGCDAICMASHGRKGVAALVLGSETAKVLTHSTIPVVVWR